MAAPTPTDSATMGTVLKFPHARRARAVLTAERLSDLVARGLARGPDEISEEYERATQHAAAKFDRDFGPAVYRHLLADLATWPAAFKRRVGESLRERRGWGPRDPENLWRRFNESRRVGAAPEELDPNGCGCGCRGFNDSFLRHLRLLREYGAEARAARAKAVLATRSKAVLARRRERIDEHKRELLELLWLHGQRRIDRARLREHAAEHLRAELADTQRWIAGAPANIREYRARLRENRSYNRSGVTDRPLSPQRRMEFERYIAETQANVPKWRARVAELEALLANPHACARTWSGCERARAEVDDDRA